MTISIKGLTYIDDAVPDEIIQEVISWFLSERTQDSLKSITNSSKSRKILHYGYRYNYRTGSIYGKACPIPLIIKNLLEYIPISKCDDPVGYFNQCIINHYLPGQGISNHIDKRTYGDIIACFTFILSESSERTMCYSRASKGRLLVPTSNGSLYIMQDAARYKWKHGMSGKQPRCFSVTFRNVPSRPAAIVVM